MVESLHYYLLLPVSLLAALCTDPRISYKFVCIGDNVEIFQDITSLNLPTDMTFYKIFENKTEAIALRYFRDSKYDDKIHPKYNQKVYLENKSLFLQDVQPSDEANYVMLYQNTTKRLDLQLCVRVPPTLRCKLNIIQEGNILFATLDNPNYCGKPLVSVRWNEHPDISDRSNPIIELSSGKRPSTYTACIEGDALNCVTNLTQSDYCKSVSIPSTGENAGVEASSTITDLPKLTVTTYVIVVIVSLVLFGVIAILTKLFWKYCERKSKLSTGGQSNTGRTSADDRAGSGDQERRLLSHPPEDIPLQPIEM